MDVPAEYYNKWEGNGEFKVTDLHTGLNAGLERPEKPADVRNWLQTVGLNAHEDYLIDSKVEKISMGLGWDQGVDVDASAGLFDDSYRVVDLVWWHKLKSDCKSVKHSGDDRTGEGGGDDEVITVEVPSIPLRVHHILFAVCIYSDGYSFHQVCEILTLVSHFGWLGEKSICENDERKAKARGTCFVQLCADGDVGTCNVDGTDDEERSLLEFQSPRYPCHRSYNARTCAGKTLDA